MRYQVNIVRSAQKSLSKIRGADFTSLKVAIIRLAENPRPHGCSKLTGREGWRIRVGNYRIIYEIHDRQLVVLVVAIGDRKDVYR